MIDRSVSDALTFVKNVFGEQTHYNPIDLCEFLDISLVLDKALNKDGYLVCNNGNKIIFVSSNIKNTHRQKFIIAHELGHFLMHRDNLYSCDNISALSSIKMNSSTQEREANTFSTQLLMPDNILLSRIPNKTLHFEDIISIASFFDVSITHAALKSIENSKTENEILLCYSANKLKWCVAPNQEHIQNLLSTDCPIDLSTVSKKINVYGVWDSLFEGSVCQEVFLPTTNDALVLLSGKRVESDYDKFLTW